MSALLTSIFIYNTHSSNIQRLKWNIICSCCLVFLFVWCGPEPDIRIVLVPSGMCVYAKYSHKGPRGSFHSKNSAMSCWFHGKYICHVFVVQRTHMYSKTYSGFGCVARDGGWPSLYPKYLSGYSITHNKLTSLLWP